MFNSWRMMKSFMNFSHAELMLQTGSMSEFELSLIVHKVLQTIRRILFRHLRGWAYTRNMNSQSEDPSTPIQKAIVCVTAFCTSCAFFMLGVLILLPITAWILDATMAPELVIKASVMLVVFGTPIVGAFMGLRIGLRATGLLPVVATQQSS